MRSFVLLCLLAGCGSSSTFDAGSSGSTQPCFDALPSYGRRIAIDWVAIPCGAYQAGVDGGIPDLGTSATGMLPLGGGVDSIRNRPFEGDEVWIVDFHDQAFWSLVMRFNSAGASGSGPPYWNVLPREEWRKFLLYAPWADF